MLYSVRNQLVIRRVPNAASIKENPATRSRVQYVHAGLPCVLHTRDFWTHLLGPKKSLDTAENVQLVFIYLLRGKCWISYSCIRLQWNAIGTPHTKHFKIMGEISNHIRRNVVGNGDEFCSRCSLQQAFIYLGSVLGHADTRRRQEA